MLREGVSMLKDVEVQTPSLTQAASQAIKGILSERQLTGYALRVYVAGGGCCGVNFGMALDNNIGQADHRFESDGVQLVVDEVSLDYLQGATIDYVNDPDRGAGFAVSGSTKESHAHAHGEGGCACGGSCDCNN
jgi:iron-sulfur cluster assembly protein